MPPAISASVIVSTGRISGSKEVTEEGYLSPKGFTVVSNSSALRLKFSAAFA
jgi:hypothetical protein